MVDEEGGVAAGPAVAGPTVAAAVGEIGAAHVVGVGDVAVRLEAARRAFAEGAWAVLRSAQHIGGIHIQSIVQNGAQLYAIFRIRLL